jgi:hypothetical protein
VAPSARRRVLFWFHGAGGSAAHCGSAPSHDAPHTTLAQLALAHGFALICGEAIQWTPPGGPAPAPAPGPVPANCLACFKSHGGSCTPGTPSCDGCIAKNAQRACTHVCEPEHVPFRSAQRAFCRDKPEETSAAPAFGGVCDACHGGQWLIPDIQTAATGPKCSPADTLDNVYMANAVSLLSGAKHSGGGSIYDTTRIFTSGCSMGSAFSIFAAACLLESTPHGTISAFATHSTGLKKKGDGLAFPPDNCKPHTCCATCIYVLMYALLCATRVFGSPCSSCALLVAAADNPATQWGECDGCEYFPTVPRKNTMKACIFDNSGDEIPGFGQPHMRVAASRECQSPGTVLRLRPARRR